MKKLKTLFLLLILVVGTFSFNGCRKKEVLQNNVTETIYVSDTLRKSGIHTFYIDFDVEFVSKVGQNHIVNYTLNEMTSSTPLVVVVNKRAVNPVTEEIRLNDLKLNLDSGECIVIKLNSSADFTVKNLSTLRINP